ncbi:MULTISPECIES: DUF4328 domain-containing protein [Shewanella]|uniref:DUF4328 domain-containing protein n=1 Tax=Shewanella TaxID=22 RepID=UPI001EFDDAD7|nr:MULTISPECIES: DUF4328 domain-containing protein [Shewanella]MCG9747704.1 DUF4328 domain-containing protein [Shewanella sp. Isolate8]MCL2908984.1 DUF4328 domain-containing protein [Shewanella aquimarina]
MSGNIFKFKDARRLTQWVRYLLYAQILVALIAISSNYLEYQLLMDYESGAYLSEEQAVADGDANDQRQLGVAGLYFVVFIVSGIMILKWIYRANFNARQLGAKEMTFTPGWSVGYFFIPVLSLWKPYQAMNEIWQASHDPENWSLNGFNSSVSLWWLLWIVSNILGQAVYRFADRAEELQDFINANLVSQISEVVSILLAFATLKLINHIYRAQTKSFARVEQETYQDAQQVVIG